MSDNVCNLPTGNSPHTGFEVKSAYLCIIYYIINKYILHVSNYECVTTTKVNFALEKLPKSYVDILIIAEHD